MESRFTWARPIVERRSEYLREGCLVVPSVANLPLLSTTKHRLVVFCGELGLRGQHLASSQLCFRGLRVLVLISGVLLS